MDILKFGAIDIGSNAVRLLISHVVEDEEGVYFKKGSLVRVPLRLGFEAFTNKKISEEGVKRIIHTMNAYHHLLEAHEVLSYRACATSAMREAKNGQEIVQRVWNETGIKIEIVEGREEAEILYATQIEKKLNPDGTYLYIDVGGGSTELSVFHKGNVVVSQSFKIGTIRLLNNFVPEKTWETVEKWVKKAVKPFEKVEAIGTGGNISKIFKISKLSPDAPMRLEVVKNLRQDLSSLSLEGRMRKYSMNPDRADVILPASDIFIKIMSWANCEQIFVPKVGVADGIVHLLYQQYRQMNQ